MLWLNWKLTLLSLAMTPAIIIVVRLISVRLRSSSRDVQRSMGDVTQVLQEAIEGHKVVKLFGGQQYEATRFSDEANRVRRYLMKQTAAAAASVPIVQLIAAIALAFIVSLATDAVERKRDHRRRLRLVHHRDAHAQRAAEARDERERAAAARARRGGEHLRADRRAGRARHAAR